MHNWKDSLQTIMHNGNFLKSDFSKSSIRNRLIFVALVKTNFDSFLCSIAKLLWCKLPSGVFDKTDMHNKLSDIGNNKVETRNPEKVNSTNKVIQFLLLNLKLVEIKLWSKINSRRVCNVFYVIGIASFWEYKVFFVSFLLLLPTLSKFATKWTLEFKIN